MDRLRAAVRLGTESPYTKGKNATDATLNWLVSHARQAAAPADLLPREPALNKKGEPTEQVVVEMRTWVPLSQFLWEKKVAADESVRGMLKTAIRSREVVSRSYRAEGDEVKDRKHAHVIEVLKEVQQVLMRNLPQGSDAGKGVQREEEQHLGVAETLFKNQFQHLEIEDAGSSGASADAEPTVEWTPAVLEKKQKRTVYIADEIDPELELRSAVETFLAECGEIRAFVRKAWLDYYISGDILLISTPATISNAAIDMVRLLEEGLQQKFKKIKCHRDVAEYMGSSCFGSDEFSTTIEGGDDDVKPMFGEGFYNMFTDHMSDGKARLEALTEEQRFRIGEWRAMAAVKNHKAVTEVNDLVHAALGKAFDTRSSRLDPNKLQTWMLMAVQIHEDALQCDLNLENFSKQCYVTLGVSSGKGLRSHGTWSKFFAKNPITPNQVTAQKAMLTCHNFVNSEIDKYHEDDAAWRWSRQPVLCGLWVQEMFWRTQDYALMLGGEKGSMASMLHIYEALRRGKMEPVGSYEKLRQLISLDDILLGDVTPPSKRDRKQVGKSAFRRFCQCIGVPLSFLVKEKKGLMPPYLEEIRNKYLRKSLKLGSKETVQGYRALRPDTFYLRVIRPTYQHDINKKALAEPVVMAQAVAENVLKELYFKKRSVKVSYSLTPLGALSFLRTGLEWDEIITRGPGLMIVFEMLDALEQEAKTGGNPLIRKSRTTPVDTDYASVALLALSEAWESPDHTPVLGRYRRLFEEFNMDWELLSQWQEDSKGEWEAAMAKRKALIDAQEEVVRQLFAKDKTSAKPLKATSAPDKMDLEAEDEVEHQPKRTRSRAKRGPSPLDAPAAAEGSETSAVKIHRTRSESRKRTKQSGPSLRSVDEEGDVMEDTAVEPIQLKRKAENALPAPRAAARRRT